MDGEDRIFLEADSMPVRSYLNKLLLRVLEQDFNELSIRSDGNNLKVTGDHAELTPPPAEHSRGVICRLKTMAAIDVSEIMLVQTGNIELTIRDKPVTLVVRTLPNFFEGESVLVTLDRG